MRKFLAIVVCKALRFVGKLVGKGSSLPGKYALKICPDILSRVQLPIVLGYHLASLSKKPKARAHAELLGLMVKEPHIDPVELKKLTMPVLVIAGTKDMIRERHTRHIANRIPNARLALIPGDHFIASKEPAAFNRAVRTFFTETAPSASKEESP